MNFGIGIGLFYATRNWTRQDNIANGAKSDDEYFGCRLQKFNFWANIKENVLGLNILIEI
jgi:hypothetical protein